MAKIKGKIPYFRPVKWLAQGHEVTGNRQVPLLSPPVLLPLCHGASWEHEPESVKVQLWDPFHNRDRRLLEPLTDQVKLRSANPNATHDPDACACASEPRRGGTQRKGSLEETIHSLVPFEASPGK